MKKYIGMSIVAGLCASSVAGVAVADGTKVKGVNSSLPQIPKIIFGVNQFNIGPADGPKWPLADDEVEWLKEELHCNTIRFPVYVDEVGIDQDLFFKETEDGTFDPSILGKGDWRSLDATIDWMIKHQITPNVCPSPELHNNEWQSKAWMSLHVPENADRSLWFTKLIVDHLTEKYGDQIIYGWYEDWWWNSYKHEDSVRFPDAFRGKLAEMYNNSIKDLNAAWGSDYKYFYKVEVPDLLVKDASGKKVVPPSAINSRRTYDLRKAMDLLHRDRLTQLHTYIKQKAPGALWIGPCVLNQFAGLADIHTVSTPRCNATAMTCAMTSDQLSADLYSETVEYYSHYRTYSKIAASQGKKLLIVEVPAIKPRSFQLVADVGGPSGGALAWCAKWDLWGFLKDDGTRQVENANEWAKLYQSYNADRELFSEYRKGTVHVYFPWETLSYTISDMNFSAAYAHVCDHMMPKDLEIVLTPELKDIPADVPIYVLGRTLPKEAIEELNRRGDQVVSFHDWFMDENGKKHPRGVSNEEFFEKLGSLPGGEKLMDAFLRVEEKANNVAYHFMRGSISSETVLAEKNQVLPGRPQRFENLISGDLNSGITFDDRKQEEVLLVELGQPREVYGAFVEFFEGDGQFNMPSRLPERIVISVSEDGDKFTEVAVLSGDAVQMQACLRFKPTTAKWIGFDFGKNTAGSGLKLVNTGVLGR
ncbi:MAG: hypothetical protein DRP64_01440 [Verrucomicrobia bacterium]|nr:MAG: hypothetical protein DRP64_01440 [Verrucomicrobiota bacterium]